MVQMQACSFHQTLEGTCDPGKDSRVLTSPNKIKKDLVAMGVGWGEVGVPGANGPKKHLFQTPRLGEGVSLSHGEWGGGGVAVGPRPLPSSREAGPWPGCSGRPGCRRSRRAGASGGPGGAPGTLCLGEGREAERSAVWRGTPHPQPSLRLSPTRTPWTPPLLSPFLCSLP